MKKRLSKKFSFSNRLSYTIIAIIALALISVGVYAYGGTTPSVMGHSIGEVAPPSSCSSGQVLSWTGSAWSCTTVSSSSSPITSMTSLYHTYNDCNPNFRIVLNCPSGKYPISGGCSAAANNPLVTSEPSYGGNLYPGQNGWACNTLNSGFCLVYVVCTNYDLTPQAA